MPREFWLEMVGWDQMERQIGPFATAQTADAEKRQLLASYTDEEGNCEVSIATYEQLIITPDEVAAIRAAPDQRERLAALRTEVEQMLAGRDTVLVPDAGRLIFIQSMLHFDDWATKCFS